MIKFKIMTVLSSTQRGNALMAVFFYFQARHFRRKAILYRALFRWHRFSCHV